MNLAPWRDLNWDISVLVSLVFLFSLSCDPCPHVCAVAGRAAAISARRHRLCPRVKPMGEGRGCFDGDSREEGSVGCPTAEWNSSVSGVVDTSASPTARLRKAELCIKICSLWAYLLLFRSFIETRTLQSVCGGFAKTEWPKESDIGHHGEHTC